MSVVRPPTRAVTAIAVFAAMVALCLVVLQAPAHSSAATSERFATEALLPRTHPTNIALQSPNAQEYGYFGYSVAISGTRVAVGADIEEVSGFGGSGRVYVFEEKTGKLLRTLTSPNAQSEGHFGQSVALSGTTLVVGAPFETVSGDSDAGHVYIFEVGTGKLLKTLVSPNVQTDGWFGYSVAISGTTVVIGAPTETAVGYPGAGNSYLFNATTGALITTLADPNPGGDGNFGNSVSINGTTAVVGEYGEVAGYAYLFDATNGNLVRTLTSPNAVDGGEFGSSVSVSGRTVVVGAVAEEPGGYYLAGRAYIFDAKTGKLNATLTSPNPEQDRDFGVSVTATATTVAVGATGSNVSGVPGSGEVDLFKASNGAAISNVTSPNASAQGAGWFGWSLALSGKTLVVGAPYQSASHLNDAGMAYIFKDE
jgi:hypothetical protein